MPPAFELPGGPLNTSDYENLERSWIDRELADRAKIRRASNLDAAELVGRKRALHGGAMVFPNFFPGELYPREYRLRLDHPELETTATGTKEKAKYLSPPQSRPLLYFGPAVTRDHLQDCSIPIAITEGEKKALALERLAFHNSPQNMRWIAVGLAGVYGWRGTIEIATDKTGARVPIKGPIVDLEKIAWPGRTVYILFDADARTNYQVRRARRQLATELRKRGAVVKIVDIPCAETKGIDDFIYAKGPDEALRLIQKSVAADIPTEFTCEWEGPNSGVIWWCPVTRKNQSGETITDREPHWISSPIEVSAMTRDVNGHSWGRLLQWKDGDGRLHQWAMPMSVLAGDGAELRKRLMSDGLSITTNRKIREKLEDYIQQAKPTDRVICVPKSGWHGELYVLPDTTIGPIDSERVILQIDSAVRHNYLQSGSLAEWRTAVSCLAAGNSRLVLGISIAFAVALIQPLRRDSAGIHLHAPSSKGKTTWGTVSGSVWGGGDPRFGFGRSWRNTSSALEAVAMLHNGALLYLDEMSQKDPKEIVEDLYHLFGGQSKGRANKTIELRESQTWNLLLVSTGELSLAHHVEVANKRLRGGTSVRLIEIPADAGAAMGIFEDLHDRPNPAAFCDEIKANALKFHGTAIREFIQLVADDQDDVLQRVVSYEKDFLSALLEPNSPGEVHRVAKVFALAAAAGELATELGITGWVRGEANLRVAHCFREWKEKRGGFESFDEGEAVAQVRHFLATHRARLQPTSLSMSDITVPYQLGWRQTGKDLLEEYCFLPAVFEREVCKGYDAKFVVQAIRSLGNGDHDREHRLIRTEGDRPTVKRTLPGFPRKVRVYVLTSEFLADSDDADEINGDLGT